MDIKLKVAPSISITFEEINLIFCQKTAYQDIKVFESPYFGRVLVIDGIVQLTERDTYIYHEMLVHPAAIRAANISKILIIGGGDGFAARECLRYTPDEITIVDIDPVVSEISKRFFPKTAGAALLDTKVKILAEDGFRYVANTGHSYDLIIIDSTDFSPYSTSSCLYSYEFYLLCCRRLSPGGFFTCQQGIPFLSPKSFQRTVSALRRAFKTSLAYDFCVPSFFGGAMVCIIASSSEFSDVVRALPNGLRYLRGTELSVLSECDLDRASPRRNL